MNALAAGHDAAVQMIDTSVVQLDPGLAAHHAARGGALRPQIELDYIERLLKDY